MDAVEFLTQYTKMCSTMNECNKCPLYKENVGCIIAKDSKETVDMVEQWTQDHSFKTYEDVFFENFPNAVRDDEKFNIPRVCRNHVFGTHFDCGKESDDGRCVLCWRQEYRRSGNGD